MLVWKARKVFRPGAPAAFLDRDGTLNRNIPGKYITRPDQIELYARVPAALRLLSLKGYRIVIITNQSGIGRGYMTEKVSAAINLKLVAGLKARGAAVDAVYCCPHTPEAGCACRKPGSGLVKEAVKDLKLDSRASFVAGDKACDLGVAREANLKGYLVLTGGGLKTAGKSRGYRDLFSVAKAVPDLSGRQSRRMR
jgi:histidinol-phosphate phosphatase family protein